MDRYEQLIESQCVYQDTLNSMTINKERFLIFHNGVNQYLPPKEDLLTLLSELSNTIRVYDVLAAGLTASNEAMYTALGYRSIPEPPALKIEAPIGTPKRNDCLYLIHDESINRLKIGRSKSPESRKRQLQTSTSAKLKLLFIIPDMGHIERDLHKQFGHLNVGYEWFTYDQSIIDHFTQLSTL